MKETFGERFQRLRKERGLTQDAISEMVNVSGQAVSKWENDINMPDISILLRLSEILDTTTDYLLGKEENTVTMVTRPEEKKDDSKMMLKVKVSTLKGDKVNVQLPLVLIKTMMEKGMEMPEIS